MGRKLFVGNLSFETTDSDLMTAFSQAGGCDSAAVIKDRMTGKSRGFGFVEMSTDEDAQRAIGMMNGRDLNGRNITVNEARERSEGGGPRPGGPRPMGGPPGGGGGGRFGPDRHPEGRRFPKEGGSRRGARARKRSL